MHDVPLENAVLLWRPADPTAQDPGEVAIVDQKNPDERLRQNSRFPMSVCAVFAYWSDLTTTERLLQLYIEMMHVVFRGHVSADAVMKACYVIPEFRDTLSDDTLYEIRSLLGICE